MYRMNDKIRSSDLFSTTILELVKLIQAALSLFGYFSTYQDEWDGLLCDVTVDSIQRWLTEIGEPQMAVEVLCPPSASPHPRSNLLRILTANGKSRGSCCGLRSSLSSFQYP